MEIFQNKATLPKILITAFAVIAIACSCQAQSGAIDLTFNTSDIGFCNGDGFDNIVRTTSIQSDGKIITGGSFSSYNGTARNGIARLNTNGLVDLTFNPGTGANNTVFTTSIQSDGKIIIGGSFNSFNGTARNSIARLNANGLLDLTFYPGTGANNTVFTTSIQSDGKIIIGGNFTLFNGTARSRIARLNTDGSLDTTFNPGTGVFGVVETTSIQSDGKIIIGGDFISYNGTPINRVARLNTDGTLDLTFNTGTGAGPIVHTTSIQSNGKIIIAGFFISYNGTARNRIARLNTDGSLDLTFNPGTGASGAINTTSIQSDGKIIIGGNYTTFNGIARNRVSRLNTDGSLDTTFHPGTGANSTVFTTSIQSDGKIIIGGSFISIDGTTRNRIARLNTDGSLDFTFNTGSGANSSVFTTAIQSDGKIIIGGNFTTFNGTTRNLIARLNTNGTLDLTFNPGAGANISVLTTSIQIDGKIIIGGNFTTFDGTARSRIARLNTDGSLDLTFDPGTGANATVHTISIQSDGKIILGGSFTTFDGIARNRIVRLNTDGSLDLTFNPGTGASLAVLTTSIQSDGKIIIGGDLTSYNGTTRNRIARLNTDGSIDLTFDPGTGANTGIRTTSIQSDGKIIIGGIFSTYNGTARDLIARLNTDGTLDLTFNPGTGANVAVYTTSIQSDGKIIIGGSFISYNGTARNRIARLNTDGSLDLSFNPGTGADSIVYTTSIQSDGKIIIGGQLTSYDGTGRNRVARLLNNTPLPVELLSFTARTDSKEKIICNWSTATETNNDFFTIERCTDCSHFDPIGTVVGSGNSSSVLNYSFVDEYPLPGISYYRLKQTDYDGAFSYSDPVAVSVSSAPISVKAYPNPTTGNILITLSSPQAIAYTMSLLDDMGRTVLVKELLAEEGDNEIPLDLSSIGKGVYSLTLRNRIEQPQSFKMEVR